MSRVRALARKWGPPAVLLVLLIGTGVWSDAMVTLAATLVGTAFVTLLGLLFGIWMGRSDRVDALVWPVLDAAQTMPAFVYLVPFLALFGTSRFTASTTRTSCRSG